MLSNFKTFLKEKIKLNENTYYLRFLLIDPKEIIFTPGQYLILKIQNKSRLYSITSSNKNKNYFDLLIKIIPNGLASNYFLNLKIEEEVHFFGPAGLFKLKENLNKKIFLATSTGIAPFLSMIRSKNYNFESEYFLFWGLRYKKDIYFIDELKNIRKKSYNKFNFKICLSQEKTILNDNEYLVSGRINIGLEKFIKKNYYLKSDFYICGGSNFVQEIKIYLEKIGIDKNQIFFENYGV